MCLLTVALFLNFDILPCSLTVSTGEEAGALLG